MGLTQPYFVIRIMIPERAFYVLYVIEHVCNTTRKPVWSVYKFSDSSS